MSKKLWVGPYLASLFIFLGLGLIYLFCYVLMTDNIMAYRQALYKGAALLAFLGYLQFAMVATIYNFAVLAKMWSAIQDGANTITTGKAIGFLFIPVFNLFWIFKAWGSYPYEYNEFAARNQLEVPMLTSRAFTAFPLLLLLSSIFLIPSVFVPVTFVVLIARVSDAVNNLVLARSLAADRPNADPGRYAQFGKSRGSQLV